MNEKELTADPWSGVQGRGIYTSRGCSKCEGLREGDCEMVQIRETEEAGQRNLVWIPDPILDLKIYFAIKNNTEITGKICILSVS